MRWEVFAGQVKGPRRSNEWGKRSARSESNPMNLSKGASVFYQGATCTVIEINYLGVRVENDETGAKAFIRANEVERALMLAETPTIKAVEVKMLPADPIYEGQRALGKELAEMGKIMKAISPGQSLAVMRRNYYRKQASMFNRTGRQFLPKSGDTPIAELRERSRASAIRDSSQDRKRG